MIKLPSEYKERPMAEGVDLVTRMHGRFKGIGLVMPAPQRRIYEKVRDLLVEDVKRWRGFPKQIRRPTVVDVGCGIGIGSNILSQEAEFVWGIDSNDETISFARQLFERPKNNIYYTPQVTFDTIDAMNEPREFAEFDYVTCIEVIEHIPSDQSEGLMKFLNRFVKKDKKGAPLDGEERTKIYLSTPNRNHPNLQKDTPRNEHHCFEPTAAEMYEFLTKHYRHVTVLNSEFEPQELSTTDSPLVYKLEIPLD